MYSHPLASVPKGEMTHQFNNMIHRVPRNVSPISHIIVPNTTGLNPNAHLTPLKGYYIRYRGKIQDKTLRSNVFKFRTGHTRRSDYRGFHYEEGYTVSGPYGALGVHVYYEYDLNDYFSNTDIWTQQRSNDKNDENKNNMNTNIDTNHTTEYTDEHESDFQRKQRQFFDHRENRNTKMNLQASEEEF